MSTNANQVMVSQQASENVFGGGNSYIPKGPRDIYGYPFTFLALAPAGTASQQVTIEQDGDFFLNTINATALVAAAATPTTHATNILPNVTIQLVDQASGRNLFFAPVPLASLAGTGEFPGRLIHPRRIQRSGTLVLQIASYDPTTTYATLIITLLGFKVYANVNR
jgi:hypothetical protein